VTGLARFKCFQRELSVIFTQKEFWDRSNSSGKIALRALVVTTVTNTLPDIKKSQWMQEPTVPKAMVAATEVVSDNTRKKLSLVISSSHHGSHHQLLHPHSYPSKITAVVLASILTCGCCYAGTYDIRPNVKILTATMLVITVSLILIFHTIAAIILIITAGNEKPSRQLYESIAHSFFFVFFFWCQSFLVSSLGAVVWCSACFRFVKCQLRYEKGGGTFCLPV
jgi:hypothetical protein